MSNILTRFKKIMDTEEKPVNAAIEVTTTQKNNVAELNSETLVQKVGTIKTIKVNEPGKPLNGFTVSVLADELGLVISQAMHKAGISSVEESAFGVFAFMNVVPKYFNLIEDEFTNKRFYILKDANRMTSITRAIYKAVGNTNSELISFPYITKTSIELPVDFVTENADFSYKSVVVESLYLTPKEIDSLNYQFIKTINFCERLEGDPTSVDLISMQIDREQWKAAPYRE